VARREHHETADGEGEERRGNWDCDPARTLHEGEARREGGRRLLVLGGDGLGVGRKRTRLDVRWGRSAVGHAGTSVSSARRPPVLASPSSSSPVSGPYSPTI